MLSRREFLQAAGLAFSGLALTGLGFAPPPGLLAKPWPPEEGAFYPEMLARVTTRAIYIYEQPDFQSPRLGHLQRDDLVRLAEAFDSPYGPAYNPRWYRLAEGYVHSGYLQRIEQWRLNDSLPKIPPGGQLGEITVPFMQAQRISRTHKLTPLYWLYYGSVHWITGMFPGPDGAVWYELTDDLLKVKLGLPAYTVRPIPPEELAPIDPHIPPEEKRLEVSLTGQTLRAFAGDRLVYETACSTGIPFLGTSSDLPTETPAGRHRISVKVPSKHMGDGELTAEREAYELLGVPWVSFFHKWGIAFHGTYWHDNFGRRMSHGCVNLRNRDALWVYRWTLPGAGPADWNTKGGGTTVDVTGG